MVEASQDLVVGRVLLFPPNGMEEFAFARTFKKFSFWFITPHA
jgi:hypothetical protein